MTTKKPGDIMVPPSRGLISEFTLRLKLILRLLGDRRVSVFLKLLPIGALVYLVWPLDFIPVLPIIGALDDAAILSIGGYLFIELAPPEVVSEHMKSLSSNMDSTPEDVVDAEATDLPDDKK